MPNDDEWVSNVKRWCLDQAATRHAAPRTLAAGPVEHSDDAVGYEAAHPALQARHWPDAPAMS